MGASSSINPLTVNFSFRVISTQHVYCHAFIHSRLRVSVGERIRGNTLTDCVEKITKVARVIASASAALMAQLWLSFRFPLVSGRRFSPAKYEFIRILIDEKYQYYSWLRSVVRITAPISLLTHNSLTAAAWI